MSEAREPRSTPQQAGGYTPKIIAFACEYCSYTAADLAGSLRLQHPANVRIVRLPCTGRVDALMLLKALAEGADAAFVSGCQPGDCHFLKGNYRAKAMVPGVKEMLAEIGLDPGRVEFFHVAASQAQRWVEVVEEMTARARKLGPNPLRTGTGPEYRAAAAAERNRQ
ncbi:MAG: hydrogenase iron-sulfur subunit [Deltaproteobacteria bacterium]|nr:hydrogenase iron-sulfur subunit [Deltaproteobacteria bacterium]